MVAPPSPALARALRALGRRYDRRWRDSDPVRWPRAVERDDDREVVAVLAALLAYGRVAGIQRTMARVLARLGDRPARTIERLGRPRLARRLASIGHRWTRGSDIAWLLDEVAVRRREAGSLGAWLAARARPSAPLPTALAAWRDAAAARGLGRTALRRRARAFLLPDVRGGGACKRLLLLARWCVRADDGIDLGLWRSPAIGTADLLVPLDVHAHRISRLLGLTDRARPDWRAVEQVTAALRHVAPEDPVAFDFALTRPGIVGRCRYRWEATVCLPCDLRGACHIGRAGPSDA